MFIYKLLIHVMASHGFQPNIHVVAHLVVSLGFVPASISWLFFFEILSCIKFALFCYLGQVELENLPLRKDALKNFDLPVEVKSGNRNRLTLL